ncbi:MAG: hypothetical protein LQ347_004824 [Umbilicaria vellea]|nr:MAG: hypothetical protein LQ347_004824 [Umbilicaria vellea]
MAAPDTVIALKTSFLNSQVRILNAPLEPSRNWRDHGYAPPEGDLKERVVQGVLHKLDSIVRHHNRTAYSFQALRHVAEQIDRLYWASGAPDAALTGYGDHMIEKGIDLSSSDVISTLPDEWPQDGEEDESGLEKFADSNRYKQLQARLSALNEQRQAQQKKLAQYKHLQSLLEPFRNPQENIQPNLVTKDGELSKELDRMKLLMARMGEKVKGLEGGEQLNPERGLVELDSREKLAALLDKVPASG